MLCEKERPAAASYASFYHRFFKTYLSASCCNLKLSCWSGLNCISVCNFCSKVSAKDFCWLLCRPSRPLRMLWLLLPPLFLLLLPDPAVVVPELTAAPPAVVLPPLPPPPEAVLLPRRRGFHPFSRLNLSMSSNISFSESRTYFSSPFSLHLCPVGLRKSPMKTLVLKLKCSLWRSLMPFFSRY